LKKKVREWGLEQANDLSTPPIPVIYAKPLNPDKDWGKLGFKSAHPPARKQGKYFSAVEQLR
jgi:uncharacterized lipoprotein